MASVAVLAADGFETIECLTIVDILRRGGVRATLVSVMGTRDVVSAQQVNVTCDTVLEDIDPDDYDYVVLPGGMPGTTHLRRDERVRSIVRDFAARKHVAAICAAPSILAELGLLEGRSATCFPGFEADFPEGSFAGGKRVVVDGNIITASAMGQALPFALEVLRDIAGDRAVEKVRDSIQL
ncbi:MAG: DJ-1 family glyoxalase III [Collinsella sp.]|nr:DJ-1 family glyoxalase III [Collinsella sp.]